ncbi:MAG: flagellar biosynthetic protein FliR, partial [Halothiobacillaceae bacterium]
MQFTDAQIGAWIGAFMWPLLRVSGMVMTMPVFTARGMPMQLRLIFAVVLTLLLAPIIDTIPHIDPLSAEGMFTAIQQLVIGAAMGFALRLAFAALIGAGHLIALGMGLGFASMVDPTNGVQVPVVSMFYSIMGTLLFLTLDGHIVAIEVLAESFRTLPIGTQGISMDGVWSLILWGSWIFAGAVLISLPAITAILAINIAFGVMTRAAPQLNIFAVGFPIIMMVGFVMMLLM